MPKQLGTYLAVFFVVLLLSKLVVLLFLFPEDLTRLFKFTFAKFYSSTSASGAGITRSEFLSKAALVAAAVPAGTLLLWRSNKCLQLSVQKNNYQIPNLPDAFNGFKIVQLSDIHSGSFNETEPIVEVIKKINSLNADVILFTGDLVNNTSDEMDTFMDVFNQLKARHGVFSITGNHDYGDYVPWDTPRPR